MNCLINIMTCCISVCQYTRCVGYTHSPLLVLLYRTSVAEVPAQARIQGGGGGSVIAPLLSTTNLLSTNFLTIAKKKKIARNILWKLCTLIWCLSTLDPPSARAPKAPPVHGRRWSSPPAKNPGSAPAAVGPSEKSVVIVWGKGPLFTWLRYYPTPHHISRWYYTGADLGGGGGGSGPEFFEGGGGVRVQVRGNFHILTRRKKKQPLKGGGLDPLTPPPHPLLLHCRAVSYACCEAMLCCFSAHAQVDHQTSPASLAEAG